MEEKILGHLSKEDYWLWRFYISEMQHADSLLKIKQLMQNSMEKDIDMAKLRAMIFKEQVRNAESHKEDKKKAYEECKADLEKKLGFSLSGTVIDEFDYAIKQLEG